MYENAKCQGLENRNKSNSLKRNGVLSVCFN